MYSNSIRCRQISNVSQAHESPFSSIGSKIKAFVHQGLYLKALQLYSSPEAKRELLVGTPTARTRFLFPSLLKACAALSDIRHGKATHSTIIISGLHYDPFIATSLINMYVKGGSFDSALKVFEEMSKSENATDDITLWNSMLDGYFKYGQFHEGKLHFSRMQLLGVRPDAYSLCILLGKCEGEAGYREGKQIHAYIVRNGFHGDPFLETAFVDMYAGCGRPWDAWWVFRESVDKSNIAAWNALISGLSENGFWRESLEMFALTKRENCGRESTTYTIALTACSCGEDADFGEQVHCDAIRTGFYADPYVCTSLLSMYAKCGLVECARKVFNHIPFKEVELWNAMIAAYVGKGYADEALGVYNQMRLNNIQIDSFTLSSILSCFSVAGLYDSGRTIHAYIVKRPLQTNLVVQSALLTMYSKFERIEDAYSVFIVMKEKDVIGWGSMISGFCQNLQFMQALEMFGAMKSDGMIPDSDIMTSIIGACVGLDNIMVGCRVHGYVLKTGLIWDIFVACSLLDMYSKCGFAEMAGTIFSDMPYKNLVAWNSIISCYYRIGLPDISLGLFSQIVPNGLSPDSFSVAIVLATVSCVATLSKGKMVHGYHIRLQIPSDLQVDNALIDMYTKCGSLTYARNVFNNMSQRNLLTWNSMISGYGGHGECLKAIGLFDNMKRSGILPDDITFLSLISSCSHSGFIEQGLSLFCMMKDEYGIEPRMEHYVNVVDLLSRGGRLYDAYNVVQNMPIEPDGSIWLCLLSASRLHRNMELGELAADSLLRLEPARGSNYVHLLNLYGEAGLRDQAANLRVTMKEKGLKKSPGCSWIEVGGKVVTFFSGDCSSPRISEVYEILSNLRITMEGRKQTSNVVLAL